MSDAQEAPTRNEGSGLWSTASASQLVLAYDQVIGFALVGSHATPEGVPCIRAFDLFNRRVAWEALHGEAWLSGVGRGNLAVRARNVYIAHEHALYVLDLLTGRPKWKVELTATSSSGGFTTYTVTLATYDLFPLLAVQPGQTTLLTAPNTVIVYADSNTQMLNTAPLAVGAVLRFNGLVFNDNGTLRMDCAQINDGVAE